MSNEVSNHWDRLVDQIIGKYDDEVTIADLGSCRGEVGELLHEAGYWKVDAYDIDITKLEKRKTIYRQAYWHNLAKREMFGRYDILAAAGFFDWSFNTTARGWSTNIKDADFRRHVDGWDKLMSNLYNGLKDDGVMIMTVPIIRYWVETNFDNSPLWEDVTGDHIEHPEDYLGRVEQWKNWQGQDVSAEYEYTVKVMRKKIHVK